MFKAMAPIPRTVTRPAAAVALTFLFLFGSSGVAARAADAPLADAAEKADWSRVRSLLSEHADVNVAQVDGMTALHWAAFHADADATKLLIAAKANAKAENRYGVTPLSLACTKGSEDVVGLLLKAGA